MYMYEAVTNLQIHKKHYFIDSPPPSSCNEVLYLTLPGLSTRSTDSQEIYLGGEGEIVS